MIQLQLQCIDNITPQIFTTRVIEPVLCHLENFSKSATQLLLGTALHESMGLKHRRQIGGPARSFFQMEPATHDDIWNNYLAYRDDLRGRVEALMSLPNADKHVELEFNDNYAAGMARVHYLRSPDPLPKSDDIVGHSNYWKKHYNTAKGKGTPTKYQNDWTAHGGPKVYFRSDCTV
ncbi:hypothetical protein [Marivita hallyeonensis]|uniref:Uncharacterized protein n=1 Tax=Marivita hallyeonensis TaxID=996342 RepID=A0A1M5N930_9RHOB|nr:hypothetical protein [Marivita hallyeonensis]SHG85985.1 hypothetical protein SAMN05443551_0815 [Marivita hallyeonensis]